MKRTFFGCIVMSLTALLWTSCSAEKTATQIVLTVDSDLDSPTVIDNVTIEVSGNGKTAPAANADLKEHGLPRTIGLVHDSGPLGPIAIKVTGLLGTAPVIKKQVETAFLEGKTTELHIMLEKGCKLKFCMAGETCTAGACGAIPSITPGEDPGTGMLDGSTGTGANDGGAMGNSDGGPGTGSGSDGGPSGGGTDSGSVMAGNAPTCTIDLPAAGDTYKTADTVKLAGACTDAESGTLTVGLEWTSNENTSAIGSGTSDSTNALTKLGTHTISLCAPDPADSTVVGCAHVDIDIAAGDQPAVSIDSMKQGNDSTPPFTTGKDITFTSTSSGAGIELEWKDDVQGVFGTASDATLQSPQIGKHHVTLTVTDRGGATNTDTRDFVVLGPGQNSLVGTFDSVNTTLNGDDVLAITSDGTRGYAGTSAGELYAWSLNNGNATASLVIGNPTVKGAIHDILLDVANGKAYLATEGGVVLCSTNNGGVTATCTNYTGGDLPSDDVRSLARLTGDKKYLLVGTTNGFLPATLDDPSKKADDASLAGIEVRDIVAADSFAYLATSSGLYRYTGGGAPEAQSTNGAPADMRSVAFGSNGKVWVGSANGLGSFSRNGDPKWTVWDTTDGLPTNDIRAVGVQRETFAGKQRDVVWMATDKGLVRYDASLESIVQLLVADGLPSDSVLSLYVPFAQGAKLLGTDQGVGLFSGP